MLSADGRYIAYESDESGQSEVYVQPFPEGGTKWQMSTDGGHEPVWAPTGRELFYRKGDKMMVVDVRVSPTFAAGRPRVLFQEQEAADPLGSAATATYDVTPDGQRFLFVEEGARREGTGDLHVVLNWFEELKRKVAPGQRER